MNDKEPRTPVPVEDTPGLRFDDGWKEILEAPDAVDYQQWLEDLADLTLERLSEAEITKSAVAKAWQVAIEQVADVVIDPEDLLEMTQSDILETALITLKLNLESIGWDEDGIIFTVPNMFTGEEATIDLRNLVRF